MDNLQPVACPYCGHEMRLCQGINWDKDYYARYTCIDCGAMASIVKESNQEESAKSAYEVATRREDNG